MKEKILGFIKQFRFRLNLGYIVGEYENTWGNPDGWGVSISLGLGLLKPDD